MNAGAPQMEDGVFYNLEPPAVVNGETFHRVECEYQVSGRPDEYVVNGIPEGGDKKKAFVLRFTQEGRVRASRSGNQEPPILKLRA